MYIDIPDVIIHKSLFLLYHSWVIVLHYSTWKKLSYPYSHHVADHGNGKEKARTSSFLYKDETYKLHRPVPFASHCPEPSHTASFRYKERWEIYSLASFHVSFKNKQGEWEWGMMVGFYRETVLCCMPLRSIAK